MSILKKPQPGQAIRWDELVQYDLTEGTKFDGDKNPLELISPFAEYGLGKVLQFGAKKYAPRNWERGIAFSRVIGAIKRHLNAIQRGEDLDPETGFFHADHLLTEAMFLSHFFHLYELYRKFDDRLPSSDNIDATNRKN